MFGRNARPRIAPGNIGGYIQAWRAANVTEPAKTSAVKATQWDMEERNPGTEGGGRLLNPAIGKHPTDFAHKDLADLEIAMGGFLDDSDRWVYDYDASKGVNWENAERLAPGRRQVQEWRGAQSFPISTTMGVHILNDLVGKNGAPEQ